MKRLSLLLTAIGTAWALHACQRAPRLTPQERTIVNALTSHLKTRCVGRYLIDVPADVNSTLEVTQVG